MSRWTDALTEGLAYGLAFAFAVMLVIGPQLFAEDEPAAKGAQAAYSGEQPAQVADAGRTLFTENCGSCHTLAAAGTSGAVGPPLDDLVSDLPTVANTIREGRGGMPAFGGRLADADIAALAAYVTGAGGN
jgi:mono/diheme cytochrome c family protein